jgi:hypothetical protein
MRTTYTECLYEEEGEDAKENPELQYWEFKIKMVD